MSTDTDADLFAFLYTIAAGVRTLHGAPGLAESSGNEADAAGPGRDSGSIESLPNLARLASVLDEVNEQLDAAEARILDLGNELAEHNPGVEAKRATHDAVRNVLDRLSEVRSKLEGVRSFDHREGPLRDFLADQRRSLAKVRRTLDTMQAASVRAEADRGVTLHRLRSGVPSPPR